MISNTRAAYPCNNLSGVMSSDEYSSDIESKPVKKTVKKVAKKVQDASKEGVNVEEIYEKKTQLEHILLRPDTYIGSTETVTQQMWVYDDGKMVYRNVTYVPGFYKIFDEILVNAADNKIRDPSMSTVRVEISKENNLISIYNDGRGIPIEIHQKEKVYVPELIFGHLLTSSNFNDTQKKVTGGRNGYGAKLCNIFSDQFVVETADGGKGKYFKQVYRNNMSIKEDPEIKSWNKEDFTRITFYPDVAKFGMESITSDLESLFKKRVFDVAGCLPGLKVFLNGERLKVRDFKQYAEMYLKPLEDGTKPTIVHEKVNDRWEVVFSLSDGQFQQISFVNNICTYKGGTHVNHVTDQIASYLLENIQKKNKAVPLKPFQIKNHMSLFIRCLIENPSFDSQTKENMTLKSSSFGSKCDLDEEFMKKVMKSGIVENILSFARYKQDQLLKKTDGHKTTRITGIAKLDDANMAGTKNSSKCTLILTEGDSAKTLAVTGLGVVGRDYYGVFPLRGKLLNVREASHKQIMDNQEINNVKQILGLQQGKSYTSVDSLRYGKVMVMTDQDHDGSHIKGLIINMFDKFWPSLLKIPGFLVEFITPIVRVTKGNKEICFYTMPEYENWKAENDEGKGWTIKYFKGLGTNKPEDAKKYFKNMEGHRKPFTAETENDRELIDMAFSKKKVEERKEWLRKFEPGTFMDHSVKNIKYSDFINRELILFSVADNQRSIPNVVDGFKPGQRKILFSCFKRNLKSEIKVAQLAGYIAEHSAYHHGEASLASTVINMAQNFVGSNNINLLEPNGQFGTRLMGGKDAASPRYIFTQLSTMARLLFHAADDQLLNYLNDDGQSIEPEWYIPIIPLVLVNGAEGIGTGWSTFIPNYNPVDLINNLKRLMKNEQLQKMHPWYRGFKGTLEQVEKDKYRVGGKITKINETTLEVTELPVRSWTQNYKEMLEAMTVGPEGKGAGFIKDYKEYHTDSTVHFKIIMTAENMKIAEQEGLEKKFKINSSLSVANMVCFDKNGRLCKFSTPEEILTDFYELRLRFYQKRKEWMSDQLTREWTRLDNRVRFVLEIIQGTLVIQNRKKKDILEDLNKKGYAQFSSKEDDSKGYDYLLSMPLWNLTMEKVENLKKEKIEKETELDILLSKTPKDLWTCDLDNLLAEWNKIETGETTQTVSVNIQEKIVRKKKTVVEEATESAKDLKPAAAPIQETDDLDLPLTERINRMLNKPISAIPQLIKKLETVVISDDDNSKVTKNKENSFPKKKTSNLKKPDAKKISSDITPVKKAAPVKNTVSKKKSVIPDSPDSPIAVKVRQPRAKKTAKYVVSSSDEGDDGDSDALIISDDEED